LESGGMRRYRGETKRNKEAKKRDSKKAR